MPEELKDEGQSLEAFMLLHRTRDLLFRCQDRTAAKFGLTAEQYSVLLAMKYLDDPVRATDIGRWMERKVNSVSMIVDRMVRAGLVDRMRDLPDRRAVRVVFTSKGKRALELATPEVWRLIEEIFSSLPREEKRNLIKLLVTLRDRALKHLNPGTDVRAIATYGADDASRLLKRMRRYTPQ